MRIIRVILRACFLWVILVWVCAIIVNTLGHASSELANFRELGLLYCCFFYELAADVGKEKPNA